jgi:hypothetical protein
MPASTLAQPARQVVAISGAEAGYQDLSQHHRAHDVNSGYVRQSFETHDPEERFGCRTTYSRFPAGVYSPRHRHNFEQIRFILEGEWEYARRRYGPGWLGLFPESVFYGPAKSTRAGRHIVVQYPGRAREPFISRDEERATQRAMADGGARFEEGICIWPDGHKQDGGEALWESWAGRPIAYPAPLCGDPLWINSAALDWTPAGAPGVRRKSLAKLGELEPAITLLRLDPGAEVVLARPNSLCMCFVYEGDADLAGRSYPAVSSFYFPAGAEAAPLRTSGGASLLTLEVRSALELAAQR